MPTLTFARPIARWLPDHQGELTLDSPAKTLRGALDGAFAAHPTLRGYVLDERGTVRHHVAVFVDGVSITDKADLDVALDQRASIFVMQALSGG